MGTNIGAKLKKIRTDNGLTQGHIASYLEVDQSYITKMEKGERKISTDVLSKLSTLYGCSEESILEEDANDIPLKIAFRKQDFNGETLKAVAAINKIALNLRMIDELLEEK
ncbi:MAG: helix-turn-helix transcriptional regulator [Eubacteriaceae bacterium]|nr:helix-turn-helix transcriptional regulator [Eubacteriaceae bacterium]